MKARKRVSRAHIASLEHLLWWRHYDIVAGDMGLIHDFQAYLINTREVLKSELKAYLRNRTYGHE